MDIASFLHARALEYVGRGFRKSGSSESGNANAGGEKAVSKAPAIV